MNSEPYERTGNREELRNKLKMLQNKRMTKHAKEVFVQKVTSKEDSETSGKSKEGTTSEYIQIDPNQTK